MTLWRYDDHATPTNELVDAGGHSVSTWVDYLAETGVKYDLTPVQRAQQFQTSYREASKGHRFWGAVVERLKERT